MEDQLELTGKERLSHLEDKLYRIREFYRNSLSQNKLLKEELEALKRKNEEMSARYDHLEHALASIRLEKDQVADNVRAVLEMVEAMEKGKHSG